MPRTTTSTHPIAIRLRERNIPVHRLAAHLGCTERLIYFWINNKRAITPRYLALLSSFFNEPPEAFR